MDALSTRGQAASYGGHLRTYVTGLVLAVILTLIPFRAVMGHEVSHDAAQWAIVICAAVQMVVHLVFFLHLNRRPEQHWYRVALVFAGLVIAILVVGTLWIMTHLNHNMMAMPAVMN
ncbi:MAG: cytochrome o ubiquinol oxidase subunit IV [Gemmatimonadales bacterium]